jgi:hypothetical protein
MQGDGVVVEQSHTFLIRNDFRVVVLRHPAFTDIILLRRNYTDVHHEERNSKELVVDLFDLRLGLLHHLDYSLVRSPIFRHSI